MDAEGIERRLRRIDASIQRTERRVESLSAMRDFHDGRIVGAVGGAESSQHQFLFYARLAFRDPYRALKAWERHEWRLSKLTLAERRDDEVVSGAFAAVSDQIGMMGLALRGRRLLGRDDAERIVAHEALGRLASIRADWLASVRQARIHGQAFNNVGAEIGRLKNRLRSARLRREDLFQDLMAIPVADLQRSEPVRRARPVSREQTLVAPQLSRRWRAALRPPEDARDYEQVQRRLAVLDQAQLRYMAQRDRLEDDIGLTPAEKTERIGQVDGRLAACRTIKRTLAARLARGRPLLPEDVTLTDERLADLRDMRRVLEESIRTPPRVADLPGLSPPQREILEGVERRVAKLDRQMDRYRGVIATLTDPEYRVTPSGAPTYRLSDPKSREAALKEARRRLARADARRAELADTLAPYTILGRAGSPEQRRDWKFIEDLQAWEREASLSVEEHDRRERDRLDRAYRRARSRDKSLSRGR